MVEDSSLKPLRLISKLLVLRQILATLVCHIFRLKETSALFRLLRFRDDFEVTLKYRSLDFLGVVAIVKKGTRCRHNCFLVSEGRYFYCLEFLLRI